MIGESFDLQIYMAYLEYKIWCAKSNYYLCSFSTFRKVSLESAEYEHWLSRGRNDNSTDNP